jgi:hypothetical protein
MEYFKTKHVLKIYFYASLLKESTYAFLWAALDLQMAGATEAQNEAYV